MLSSLRNNTALRRWHDLISFHLNCTRSISGSHPLAFHTTPARLAEPLKRKKRIDPAVLKAREERAKKRIERSIRLLERMEKCLKPIEEARIPQVLYSNADSRKREIIIPDGVIDERILLCKEWSRFKNLETNMDRNIIKRLLAAQNKALEELRKESEELYQAAIQIDTGLIPFSFKGPTETPPTEGYETPDGDYFDISKDWSKEL